MSEVPVDDFDDEPTQPAGAPPADPKPDDTDWKAEAQKWERRARADQKTSKELERQQRLTMTDAERQVAEARTAGRVEATTALGTRLVRTEFDALAARRNADYDTTSTLEYVDLTKFVGEDGEPDSKAIKAAVDRLVPAPANGPPSFDSGSRSSAGPSVDMNQLIRRSAGIG